MSAHRSQDFHVGFRSPTICTHLAIPKDFPNPPFLDPLIDAILVSHSRAPHTARGARDALL